MFTVDQSITIQRPVAEVFNYVRNPHNITQWRPDVLGVKSPTGQVSVGLTFEELVNFMGKKTYTMRVTEFDPNHREVIEAIDGPDVRPTQTFTYQLFEGGTQFNLHVDVETYGFFRLMEPMFPGMFSKIWAQYLVNVKTILENGAA